MAHDEQEGQKIKNIIKVFLDRNWMKNLYCPLVFK